MRSVVQKIIIAYGRQHVVLAITRAGRKFVGRVVASGEGCVKEFSASDPGSVVEFAVSYVLAQHSRMASSGRKVSRRVAA